MFSPIIKPACSLEESLQIENPEANLAHLLISCDSNLFPKNADHHADTRYNNYNEFLEVNFKIESEEETCLKLTFENEQYEKQIEELQKLIEKENCEMEHLMHVLANHSNTAGHYQKMYYHVASKINDLSQQNESQIVVPQISMTEQAKEFQSVAGQRHQSIEKNMEERNSIKSRRELKEQLVNFKTYDLDIRKPPQSRNSKDYTNYNLIDIKLKRSIDTHETVANLFTPSPNSIKNNTSELQESEKKSKQKKIAQQVSLNEKQEDKTNARRRLSTRIDQPSVKKEKEAIVVQYPLKKRHSIFQRDEKENEKYQNKMGSMAIKVNVPRK